MLNWLNSVVLIIAAIYLFQSAKAAFYEYKQSAENFAPNEDILEGLETGQLEENDFMKNTFVNSWEIPAPREIEEEDLLKPENLQKLGQISGLATQKNDTLYIFHRGNHFWDYRSFDLSDQKHKNNGPIKNDTVIILNTKTGEKIQSWGAETFYMPHGISVDMAGNIWLTDVVRHQVFRYKRGSYSEPDLVLGEAFISGKDEQHFCMPTDVAISSSGIVYISDGYCNSRILIVSPLGDALDEIGLEENMVIPHSLTLLEEENLICVADRENKRVLCYTAGLDGSKPGVLMFNLHHPRLGQIFAIDHIGDVLLILSINNDPVSSEVIFLDLATERLVNSWAPASGFKQPHDLAVTPDGKFVYVSDIGAGAVKNIVKMRL